MRSNIPDSVSDDFARSGIAHLLAISGLHLGFVAGIMMSLGIWLFGRRHYHYIWLALGVVWVYALFTGMNPPVVRAAIMVSLFLIADTMGRQRSALTTLLLAAAIMIGISPYLTGNASFQLSFLAMAGLIFIFPQLQAPARSVIGRTIEEDSAVAPAAKLVADSFCVTLAAMIAVWPLVAYYFGIVSLVGPLATFLAVPALPAILIIGLLTGLTGFIALPVAQVFGWLSWLFLLYIIGIAHLLGTPIAAFLEVNSISPALLLTYYTLLAIIIGAVSHRRKLSRAITPTVTRLKAGLTPSANLIDRLPIKLIIPPLLALAIIATLAAATMPDDRLHVNFLDVGEGDAILVQRGSQQILIDGGPSPQTVNLELGRRMPFWNHTIDLSI
ncbi:ComEC/Rec2 family competence protein [Chloroflexota bacterium]